MLDKLYKKLHIIFIGAIMLVITMIVGIVSANSIREEKMNDSTFFQRMATMLIYQLNDSDQTVENTIRAFEDEYPILCLLQDSDKNIIYQGDDHFSTKTLKLLESFNEQNEKIGERSSSLEGIRVTTTQSGILEIEGTSNDRYWGIDAEIVTREDNIYHLSMFYRQKYTIDIFLNNFSFYVTIWLASLFGVIIITHFLIKKALKPTEYVLKSQKDFIASASHELKSPLAVILTNADIIDRLSTDNLQIQRAVKTVDSECMRMSKLIKSMLTLASSDSKTWTLNKENVIVDTLLIALYEAYELLCIKNKITLNIDILESSYPALYTDKECVFQILSIFMDNTIQHSKNNLNIEVRAVFNIRTITFYVEDHGQGIADINKPYVFDRFYCVDKAHTDKPHFGLGLSIADELAKMLDGNVGLNDTEGGGITFFVTIPLK